MSAQQTTRPAPDALIPPLTEGNDDDLANLRVPFPVNAQEADGESSVGKPNGEDSRLTDSSSQQSHSDKLTDLPSPGSASPRLRAYNRSIQLSIEQADLLPSALSDGDLPRNTANVLPSPTPSRPADGTSRVLSDSSSVPESEAWRTKAHGSLKSSRPARSRTNRLSDPGAASSPSLAAMLRLDGQKKYRDSPNLAPPTKASSQPQSRASSPLRVLQQWSNSIHRARTRDEPFVPVNPFNFKSTFRFPFTSQSRRSHDPAMTTNRETQSRDSSILCSCIPLPATTQRSSATRNEPDLDGFLFFMTNTLPRRLYLLALLRIPSMYFSRVSRIFEDAEVSQPDIERIIDSFQHQLQSSSPSARSNPTDTLTQGIGAAIGHSAQVGSAPLTNVPLPFPEDWSPPLVSPALIRFRHSWETFIDSLMREWKTLNLVSALLLSAIVTVFQIPNPASDPITRNFALVSLTCALMSLSYGCVYIVRFGTMRSMSRASRWAEEARKHNTLIWWNVWVMLAMPAIWLAWAMIWFITTILCFVWRSGSVDDPEEYPPIPVHISLAPRIIITSVFIVGFIYFILIVKTLRSYGTSGYGPQQRWRVLARMSMDSDARARLGPYAMNGDGHNYFSPGSSPRSAAFELADDVYERRGRGRAVKAQHAAHGASQTQFPPSASANPGGVSLGRSSPAGVLDAGNGIRMQREAEKVAMEGLGISGIGG